MQPVHKSDDTRPGLVMRRTKTLATIVMDGADGNDNNDDYGELLFDENDFTDQSSLNRARARRTTPKT